MQAFDGVALGAPDGAQAPAGLGDLAARGQEAAQHDAAGVPSGGAEPDVACGAGAAALLGLPFAQFQLGAGTELGVEEAFQDCGVRGAVFPLELDLRA